MSTVEEIRSAIERLSLEERAQIIAELCGWTDDDWDRQIRADAAAGKFTPPNREAAAAPAAAQTRAARAAGKSPALTRGAAAAPAAGQTRPLNDIPHEP